jgi:hypothetical protein
MGKVDGFVHIKIEIRVDIGFKPVLGKIVFCFVMKRRIETLICKFIGNVREYLSLYIKNFEVLLVIILKFCCIHPLETGERRKNAYQDPTGNRSDG